MDTDQELFSEALADEPATHAEPAPSEADIGAERLQDKPEQPAERGRDEKGRFASQKPEPAPAATAEAEQPAKRQPDVDHRVPLRELLDERDRRQHFEREIEKLQRQIAEMQRASQPKPQTPDIFENPNGFVESVEDRIERRFREQEANFALKLAHREHGKEFETAYENLIRAGHNGDRASVQSVLSARDPGEALMRWHKQRVLVEKTGGDLDGFLKKREDELLDNPEFLKRVAEKLRAQAGGVQSNTRPAVNLPPSLSRIAPAAPQSGGSDDDMSDRDLLRASLRR